MTQNAVYKASRVANEQVTAWLSDHAVIVEDGLIADVLPQSALPGGIGDTHEVHDLGDVSLLPGLIEAHAHMHTAAGPDPLYTQFSAFNDSKEFFIARAVDHIRTTLLSGVTTVRDLGGPTDVVFPVRDAVRAGVIPGPRLQLAGAPITTTAGHCWFFGSEADTADEVVRAVREQVKLGADVIKIMSTGGMFTPTANPRSAQYPVETLRAAVVEAERLNVQIVSHCLAAEGVRNCVEAGIHCLIHARWHDSDFSKKLDYDPDVAQMAADKGIWADPTTGHIMIGDVRIAAGDVPPRIPHWAVTATTVPEEEHDAVLRDMRERGVRFVTGLDMGMAHGEFDMSAANAWSFVDLLGFTNWEAMAASTVDTAESLRLSAETGAIKSGLSADLMAVSGDPANDIQDLFKCTDVVMAGKLVKRDGRALV
ncbi:MAG: amidohydrolase family protein [Chloroflexi bacterium]|nr:amidohydrolase family protein [Chloroflexota bacterium]MBT4074659.1 amidohydrolase family protein [Chloroflexota bacterium]MBT4516065.1 amidohydrolase family protein [Chloroflexota bacterium]MBT6683058.1 amidohydrolase family protein [Chloroflexota bacterium]